jgi:regulatory protein
VSGDDVQRAKDSAFRLLAYRARSARELRQRLSRKGYRREVIDEVIKDLQSKGYQSDEEFARQFAHEKWSGSGWGPVRVRQELRRKGISSDLVEQIIEEVYSDIDIADAVLPLAIKRWVVLRDLPADNRRRRISGYLQRRGYDWETIGKIMKRLEK